ncbi:MAG: hypothetical protein MK074_08585, partial [Phycisphaerales bacterium]|nr:hypothetical protein [Phycisphaerales bacterium]
MAGTRITFWERYTEFIVLGLVACAFVGVVAMQFIGSPNAWESRGQDPIQPGDLNGRLLEAADRLDTQIKKPGVPDTLDPGDAADLEALFQSALATPVGTPDGPTLAYATRGTIGGDATALTTATMLVEPVVPTPTDIMVYQTFDTLEDETVSAHADLQAKFAAGGPYDVTWLTVAAKFDAKAMLDQMATEANGAGRIPEHWYDGRIDVLDVRVERRMQLPDGSWSEPTLVDLLPDMANFRDRIGGIEDVTSRDRMIDDLRQSPNQHQVLQPDFLPTRSGLWRSPEDHQTTGPVDPLDALRALIARKTRVQKEYDDLGGGGFGGGGSGGGGFGPGGGGGGGGFGPGGGGG